MKQQIQNPNWKKLNRQQRGELLYKSYNIKQNPRGWRVPSQTYKGKIHYLVTFNKNNPRCNCSDFGIKKVKCKHIYAVEFYLKKKIDKEGKVTQTKGVKITYAQQWSAYNKSQTNEKLVFMKLLKDLCNNIEQPLYKFGRPTLPFSDMLFGCVMKIYTGFSLRRFMSDMKISKEMGLINKIPCYSSLSNFMNKKEIKSVIEELIITSSLPLKEIEKDFAADSSGFSTSRFGRWFDYKYGKEKTHRLWIKAHIISGIKTNIITSVEITDGNANDSPQLSNLVQETAKHFGVREVSCDRAYCSRKNLKLIEDVGAVPYIPFKKNVTGKRPGNSIWIKMYHYFMYKHDEFLEHYHKRSNVETVFNMIKTKFGSDLKSKKETAQVNELLIKILCHDICVFIQEVNELGIKAEFKLEETIDL